ncbi:MAG: hypothetical protein WEF50_05470 [Myxococcota bacterium]
MLRRGLGLCLVLAAPLLMACAAIPAIFLESLGEKAFPAVDESANAYNQNVRWGRIQQAAAQMPEDQREQFIALFDDDDGPFRFTSVEVLSATPKAFDGREVDVLVAWEYYSPPGLTERKLRQKQAWHFLELERRWEVVPDLAVFEAIKPAASAPVGSGNGAVPASPMR